MAKQFLSLCGVLFRQTRKRVPSQAPLSAKEGEDQAKNDTDDNAGDDRKIERGVSAFNPDIAWETAQPTGAEAAPQQGADQDDHDSDDDEKFADFGHRVHFA